MQILDPDTWMRLSPIPTPKSPLMRTNGPALATGKLHQVVSMVVLLLRLKPIVGCSRLKLEENEDDLNSDLQFRIGV